MEIAWFYLAYVLYEGCCGYTIYFGSENVIQMVVSFMEDGNEKLRQHYLLWNVIQFANAFEGVRSF